MTPSPSPQPRFSSILVLCEANHCRSPIAEGLFREALGPAVEVASAGLRALEGFAAHHDALEVLAERGIDLSAHRGRQLTLEMALAADLILVMDQSQRLLCERMMPSVRGRVYLVGQWLEPPEEVDDPFGYGPEAFRRTLELIDRCVEAWRPRILPEA